MAPPANMVFDRWTREEVIKHWESVLEREGLPAITYETAREALRTLNAHDVPGKPREPGEDDE